MVVLGVTVQGSAWEEAGPQLLLWSGLQAEQHLLVDRCRDSAEQLSSVWPESAGRGSVRGCGTYPGGGGVTCTQMKGDEK